MRGKRIHAYPVVLDGFTQALPDIKEMEKKERVDLSIEKDPEHRSIDEERLVWAHRDIMAFMRKERKSNTWDASAPEDKLWEHSFYHAIKLAKRCDVDYKAWGRLSKMEKKFFEGAVEIVDYAAKKAKAVYDSDLEFTARQLRCVLKYMKAGQQTPLCAR